MRDLLNAHIFMSTLIYLIPTFCLAIFIKFLIRKSPVFYFLTLAGTFTHELSHWIVGFITFASPHGLTIVPKREGDSWTLGSVSFKNLRWFNAAPTALAPFLLLIIPFVVAKFRTAQGVDFNLDDIWIAFLLAPQLISFWPSSADWRLAIKSWPYLIIGLGVLGYLHSDWIQQFMHS